MAVFLNISLALSSLFLVFAAATQSQNDPAGTVFTGSEDSPAACEAFVTYCTRSPYSDVGSISGLFGISRMDIASATGLAAEAAPLATDQLLLVPIRCTSNGTHYFSNITYQIKKGDSFYSASIKPFRNLTNYYLVEEMNRALNPTNLTVRADAAFPLLCNCPRKSYTDKGIQYLVTYVWQPGNDVISVSNMFQALPSDTVMENNNRNFTAAIWLPVLIPVKSPIILQKFHSAAAFGKSKHHWLLMAILGFVMAFLIVSFGLAAYLLHLYKKNKNPAHGTSSLEASDCKVSKGEMFERKTMQGKLLPGVSGYLVKPIMYDPLKIAEATMNLNERFRIGGSMYKAVINDRIFAVKQTRDATEELQILHRVNHANLVKLMGVSSDNGGSFSIVYEYAEKGSLDKWLFPQESSSDKVEPESWNHRLSIALDVADGLQCLLEHTQPRIVHRDISTKSILLDSDFKAKISCFTTAKSVTASCKILYVDVFAFGVVLLELLSGKRAMGMKDSSEAVILWKQTEEILDIEDQRNGRLRQWMDPNLKGCYPFDDAIRLAMLARACT